MSVPVTVARNIIGARKNVGTWWDVIRQLTLNGNMQWCFDTADIGCIATAADQTWVNRGVAGSTPNLTLGIDTGSSTDDPAYFGTPGGQSAAERFYFDGGDFFRQTNPGGAQPAWVQRLHKDNALFAMGYWCYFTQLSAIHGCFATFDGNTSVTGTYFRVNSNGKPALLIGNGSGTIALNVECSRPVLLSKPCFFGVAVDEASGTGFFQVDGHQESFTSTYSSPSGGSYGAALRVCSSSGTTHRFQAGNAIFGLFVRESSTMTPAEMMAFYDRSRRRFF